MLDELQEAMLDDDHMYTYTDGLEVLSQCIAGSTWLARQVATRQMLSWLCKEGLRHTAEQALAADDGSDECLEDARGACSAILHTLSAACTKLATRYLEVVGSAAGLPRTQERPESPQAAALREGAMLLLEALGSGPHPTALETARAHPRMPWTWGGGDASAAAVAAAVSADKWRELHTVACQLEEAALEAAAEEPAPAEAADVAPAGGLQQMGDVAVTLGALHCSYLPCTNASGSSESSLASKWCGACRQVRYCSTACCKADWRQHKLVCRQLAAQAAGGRQG